MKVEVGESLMYSYLSHIKGCQIVQTNWKISSSWKQYDFEMIDTFLVKVRNCFLKEYQYDLFGKSLSTRQILRQCECDAMGVHFTDESNIYYSVDVAFHENGLNYGSKKETTKKVVEKLAKAVACMAGCFHADTGAAIFVSPKITPAIKKALDPCVDELNRLITETGMRFTVSVIANEEFKQEVLDPVLEKSSNIADTSELFVRSCQLLKMFY